MSKNLLECFHSHFKNTSKKLKIVCDWDEVMQPHEPYALWLTKHDKTTNEPFATFFKNFWEKDLEIVYSPYGSKIKGGASTSEQQQIIKNSPEFYQKAPFLSLAKELLKLVKENKAQVVFLSAYDQRVFANGEPRKKQIFAETFGKIFGCSLNLVGFSSEKTGKTKSEWISENVPDCDILLDDNPNILIDTLNKNSKIIACAPYYPAVEDKHEQRILLIKTSVSDLKKEDF